MSDRQRIAVADMFVVTAALWTSKLAIFVLVSAAPVVEWPAVFGADALLAVGVGALSFGWSRRSVRLAIRWLVVAYAALTVLVVEAIGAPPSFAMLAGIDKAIGGSVGAALSVRGVVGAAVVLGSVVIAGTTFSIVSRRGRANRIAWSVAASVALVAAVALATPSASRPMHRNALGHLLAGLRTPVGCSGVLAERPRGTPVDAPDLLRLRGAARDCNVIVVVLESVPALELRQHGAAKDPMPFVSELACNSLVCTDAYAVYPESIKGQVAIFHGLHPAPRTSARDYVDVPVPGVATDFAAAGYRTAMFHSGRFAFLGMQDVLVASGFRERFDAHSIEAVSTSDFGVDEESTVDALLAWIDEQRGAPFFAAYLPIAGHHPYDAPPGGPFAVTDARSAWQNAVHNADRCVRRLWDGIGRRELAADTLLVIVGDHGQAFGQHAGNFGHTFEVFEENVRVPLLFHAPSRIPAAQRVRSPVSHVDLVPTLLELCGLPPRSVAEGSSILAERDRPVLFFADWGALCVGVRVANDKVIVDLDAGRASLFDLGVDPFELHDRAASQPAKTAALRALAERFFAPRTMWVRSW